MPSGVTLPTFSDTELLTYEKLNSFADAVNARFTAGISTSDLVWPLVAEDNLNMSAYDIIGGYQIWDVGNADNFDSLADAFTGVSTNGVVFVPPNTTVTTPGNQAIGGTGVSALVGAGPKSSLQLSAGSVSMLVASSAGTGLYVANLTLDGNSQTTADGLDITSYTDVVIENVKFKNFDGKAISLTSCVNVTIRNCVFDSNDIDVYATECGNLFMSDNLHYACNEDAIQIDAAGAASVCHVHATNIEIRNPTQRGIYFAGFGAVGATNDCEFHGNNIVIQQSGATYDAMTLGTSTEALDYVNLAGCTINNAGGIGVVVNSNRGSITGCVVDSPTSQCIDLDTSTYVAVSDCVLLSGTVGVDLSDTDCDNCYVTNNKIDNCTTPVSLGDNTSQQHGNTEQVGVLPMSGWCATGATACGTDTITYGGSYTIPANTLRVGDKLTAHTGARVTGAAGSVTIALQCNGSTVLNISGDTGESVYIQSELVFTHSTTAWAFARGVNTDGATITVNVAAVTGLDITSDQVVRTKFNTTGLASTDGWIDGGLGFLSRVELQ